MPKMNLSHDGLWYHLKLTFLGNLYFYLKQDTKTRDTIPWLNSISRPLLMQSIRVAGRRRSRVRLGASVRARRLLREAPGRM